MAFESDKIMFEIYKDALYNQKYRVVYYTELNEHNKHSEISRAMSGNSFYDGFIKEYLKEKAKKIVGEIVDKLNAGEDITPAQIRNILKEFTP